MVDELARRAGVAFESAPVEALIAQDAAAGSLGDAVLLAKPMTFMNLSGEAVGGLLRYFKIDPADLLVIVDEVQLPLARLRARPRGSAGGHNGLKSIIGAHRPGVSRGCGSASGAATPGATWRITCWRRFDSRRGGRGRRR